MAFLKKQNPYLAIERGAPGHIGWRIHYFDEIDSTQEAARELAAAGADQGTLVIAERQTAGRGRMGRAWHSPSGVNLYTTIILRPPIPLADVPRMSLVAGVAAADSGAGQDGPRVAFAIRRQSLHDDHPAPADSAR